MEKTTASYKYLRKSPCEENRRRLRGSSSFWAAFGLAFLPAVETIFVFCDAGGRVSDKGKNEVHFYPLFEWFSKASVVPVTLWPVKVPHCHSLLCGRGCFHVCGFLTRFLFEKEACSWLVSVAGTIQRLLGRLSYLFFVVV